MPALHTADQDLLQKLLLGQLPTAEVERLAAEYADDGRLAELAESLAGKDDALLALLHHHETAAVDPDAERLVERLLERLKPAIPVQPRDDTAAMNKADASTEPSLPHETAQPQPLPERLEHYRPIKVLGQGGMGTVYLAEDTRLGREVAIKTLRPELASNPQFKERFLREARTAAKLEHDNIIPIYSVGEADGTPFLAMPLLKGEPLDALIRRTAGPLPVATAVRIARETASGLAAAHARGLIHRDIKPANIWLEAPVAELVRVRTVAGDPNRILTNSATAPAPTGRVKILDFGLAKAADAGSKTESDTNLTASGAIVGTPAFMAPEQAGGHPVDGRADLFSLGCVLYELLSGQRAFSGPNTMSILMSLANHTPTAPDKLNSQCPPALSRLVMQLLEKDPANRPASAEAVIEALDELEIASAAAQLQASRAASAPGHSPDDDAVRGLTPAGSPKPDESDASLPSDSSFTLPSTAVFPVRRRTIPQPRVAFALAGLLLLLLAAVVYHIQTDNGTLVVTIDDPAVQAILEQDGLVIRDKHSDRTWTIKATESQPLPSGEYQLKLGQQLLVTDESGAELKTDTFALKRKGEFRVRVTLDQAARVAEQKPATSDPDRRAAEWVLLIGGSIKIKENGEERGINAGRDLPEGPFELTLVSFEDAPNPKVTDSGLANFKDCQNLTTLRLHSAQVSDAGLAIFKDCKKLTELDLVNTPVSDAGLVHFKGRNKLTTLALSSQQVTDAGLANFKDCKNLTTLMLGSPQLSDAGLAFFRDCPNLTALHISSNLVTDEGLAAFKDCKKLTTLTLMGSDQVTDAGLAVFKDCENLSTFTLYGTQVRGVGLAHFNNCQNLTTLIFVDTRINDAGLVHFKNWQKLIAVGLHGPDVSDTGLDHFLACPKLTSLSLTVSTKVTEAGVKKLSGALPGCKIEWDGGVIEPRPTDPDRHAAEYVLSIGGNIKIKDNGQERELGTVGDLPRAVFELTGVVLNENPKVTDAGLAHFKDCKNLAYLGVYRTQVSDAGLAHFKDFRNLTYLDLQETKVSDAGLAHFKDCKNLTYVCLIATQVSDTGLAHFRDCKNLASLRLSGTQVSDTGLAHFQDCKNLTELDLESTQVSDAGLAHFRDCKNLVSLRLSGTQVSDTGLAHFKDCKNLTSLRLTQTQVSDAGLAHFNDCKNLTSLFLGGGGTQVGDAGLAHFQDCKKLTYLFLGYTQVSDAGLAHFQDCKNLTDLFLTNTQVSDAGLAHFQDCKNLANLVLTSTQVTGAGLAHFKDCKNLTYLGLGYTQVSDAGLPDLANLPDLQILILDNTRISLRGHEQLKAALPKCQITWSEPNRSVAESVLALGGSVEIGSLDKPESRPVQVAADLPGDYFQVRRVSLAGVTKPLDPLRPLLAWLTFPQFDRLESIDLSGSTGLDYSFLVPIHGLRELTLANAGLNDASLANLPKLPTLQRLVLDGNDIRGNGLTHLSHQPELIDLSLSHPNLTNLSAENLAELKRLKRLSLAGSGMTNAGIKHLATLTNLESLDLRRTKATATGIDELKAVLPKCKIEWDGMPGKSIE